MSTNKTHTQELEALEVAIAEMDELAESWNGNGDKVSYYLGVKDTLQKIMKNLALAGEG